MKVKSLVSFCGPLTMAAGEIGECSDEALLSDLLQAGYIEPAEESAKPAEKEAEKPKTARRAKKS